MTRGSRAPCEPDAAGTTTTATDTRHVTWADSADSVRGLTGLDTTTGYMDSGHSRPGTPYRPPDCSDTADCETTEDEASEESARTSYLSESTLAWLLGSNDSGVVDQSEAKIALHGCFYLMREAAAKLQARQAELESLGTSSNAQSAAEERIRSEIQDCEMKILLGHENLARCIPKWNEMTRSSGVLDPDHMPIRHSIDNSGGSSCITVADKTGFSVTAANARTDSTLGTGWIDFRSEGSPGIATSVVSIHDPSGTVDCTFDHGFMSEYRGLDSNIVRRFVLFGRSPPPSLLSIP